MSQVGAQRTIAHVRPRRLRKKAEGKHTTQMPNMFYIPFAASIALETKGAQGRLDKFSSVYFIHFWGCDLTHLRGYVMQSTIPSSLKLLEWDMTLKIWVPARTAISMANKTPASLLFKNGDLGAFPSCSRKDSKSSLWRIHVYRVFQWILEDIRWQDQDNVGCSLSLIKRNSIESRHPQALGFHSGAPFFLASNQ